MLQKIPPHHTTSPSIKHASKHQASKQLLAHARNNHPSSSRLSNEKHSMQSRSSSTQHSPARYHLLSFFSLPYFSFLATCSTHIDAYSQAIGSFFSYPRHLQSLLSANRMASPPQLPLSPLQQGWSGSLPSPLLFQSPAQSSPIQAQFCHGASPIQIVISVPYHPTASHRPSPEPKSQFLPLFSLFPTQRQTKLAPFPE